MGESGSNSIAFVGLSGLRGVGKAVPNVVDNAVRQDSQGDRVIVRARIVPLASKSSEF